MFSAGDFPNGRVIGDLNGDGDPDLAVTSWTENIVSVFLNSGDGSFAADGTYSTGVGPLASAISDLDGDGDLDGNCTVGASDLLILLAHWG